MRKQTAEEIKKRIEESTNGEYITDGVIGEDHKIVVTHVKCGYSWRVVPKSIYRGDSHCPSCSMNLMTYKKLLKLLDNDGFELIEPIKEKYSVKKDYVTVKCKKCGKISKFLINNITARLKSGVIYCSDCVNNKNKQKWENSDNKTKQGIENAKKNFNILSVEKDKNNQLILTVQCKKCGNISKKSVYSFKDCGCKYCANNIKKSQNEINEKITDITDGDYELVGDYKNNHTKITVLHKKCGNTFQVTPVNFFTNNSRCPFCHTSKFQKDIYDFIKTLDSSAIINDKSALKNKELDIYIPDKKIGFECDGLYWHSENNKNKNYQVDKLKECQKLGIRLINIFEDEYEFKKDLLFNKIKHILNADNSKKIYARSCSVKNITSKEKNEFLNKFHIQGTTCSSINLGLYYKEILVAVLTFAKPRIGIGKNKNNNINRYELTRFATNTNYRIIGGFSKLLSNFKRKYIWDEIYTYGDLRWVDINKNVYITNGFKLKSVNPPAYWYFYNKNRYHRFGFRKDAIKNKFPEIYNSNLTEFEMMDKTKYKRIWDCGTATYILENTK